MKRLKMFVGLCAFFALFTMPSVVQIASAEGLDDTGVSVAVGEIAQAWSVGPASIDATQSSRGVGHDIGGSDTTATTAFISGGAPTLDEVDGSELGTDTNPCTSLAAMVAAENPCPAPSEETGGHGGKGGTGGTDGGSTETTGGASGGALVTFGGGSSAAGAASAGQVLGASTEEAGCNYLGSSYLRMGRANDKAQLTRVQQFLKDHEGAAVAVTGIFDKATFDAVSAFQKKYADDILKPWGYTEPTGIIYITTQKKINELVCGQPVALTTEQTKEVDNYRTSFLAKRQGLAHADTATPAVNEVKIGNETAAGIPSEEIVPETVSTVFETNEKVVNQKIFGVVSSIVTSEKIKDVAGAVFSMPHGNDLFEAIVLFIVSVLILNVISTYVGRRPLVFGIGSILGIAGVSLFDRAYLVTPFAFLFALSIVFFVRGLHTVHNEDAEWGEVASDASENDEIETEEAMDNAAASSLPLVALTAQESVPAPEPIPASLLETTHATPAPATSISSVIHMPAAAATPVEAPLQSQLPPQSQSQNPVSVQGGAPGSVSSTM